jgi:D-glycero-alpha-D-manno-heptose-7-phosphate kinase
MDDLQLVNVMRDLEARILTIPTGAQDHWPAIMGGALALHHQPGGPNVERLDIDPEWIGSRLTVFYTGLTHHSGMVNWQVIRRQFDGDRETSESLGGIAAAARECRDAILRGDAERVAAAVEAEWSARKRLAPEVCPPELERLERVALANGALAIKACGAGGGGSILLWHSPDVQTALTSALEEAAPKGHVLATSIATEGGRVITP